MDFPAIKMNEIFGDFILRFRRLEKLMLYISNGIKLEKMNERLAGFNMQSHLLFDKGIIPENLYISLKQVLYIRNAIVHNTDLSLTLSQIAECEIFMDEAIKFLENYINKPLH